MALCSSCGHQIDPQKTFCVNCGKPIVPIESSVPLMGGVVDEIKYVVCPECQIIIKEGPGKYCISCGASLYIIDIEMSGREAPDEDVHRADVLVTEAQKSMASSEADASQKSRDLALEAIRADTRNCQAYAVMASTGLGLAEAESAWKRALLLNNHPDRGNQLRDYQFAFAYNSLVNLSKNDLDKNRLYLACCLDWISRIEEGSNADFLRNSGITASRHQTTVLNLANQPKQQTAAPTAPCPYCGQGMRFIQQYNKYWCDRCMTYDMSADQVYVQPVFVKNSGKGIGMIIGGCFVFLFGFLLCLTIIGAIIGIPICALGGWLFGAGINNMTGRMTFQVSGRPSVTPWVPGRSVPTTGRVLPPPS